MFFFGFPKVPFTCDYLRKKLQLTAYAGGYLYAYSNYVSLRGNLKGWAASDASHLVLFFAASAILFAGLLIYRALARAERSKIIYDEPYPSFQQLNLS